MTPTRTIADLIARLQTIDPSTEVALIEDHDGVIEGVDLRTPAAFLVTTTGPIGPGPKRPEREVLVLVASGGRDAILLARTAR